MRDHTPPRMSLALGREYLAIPGPSVMPDAVLRAMHRAAPNIYTGELAEMIPTIVADLKTVARTRHDVAMYIANGHGAWEAALANVLSPGDKVLALACGRFGHGWGECATRLGAEVEILDFGRASPVDPDRVAARLAADPGHAIKAVLFTHVDTSSSALSDTAAVRAAIDAAGHPALLMSDNIASLVCDRFEMDGWGADIMVTGSQKGLMLPPGLSFNGISGKALEAAESAQLPRSYWSWADMLAANKAGYFPYTPATSLLFGLRESIAMLNEEGLDNVFAGRVHARRPQRRQAAQSGARELRHVAWHRTRPPQRQSVSHRAPRQPE